MKITGHTAKDIKGTDIKNLSNHGLFQERKKTQGIFIQTK
jgi:hypothetical protein